MKHLIINIITVIISIASSTTMNAITANDILEKASDKFTNSKSISATFSLIDNGISSLGNITIASGKFFISTPQLSTWFDGKTQWTYSSEINEVNVCEPTQEELQQINPFALIFNFRTNYNAKLLSKNNCYKISLTPKLTKQSIKDIEITFNSSTHLPSLIILTTKDNHKTTIKIKSITVGKSLPASTFVFNASNYPGVEIIDLR